MSSMTDASDVARRQGLADSLAKIRHHTASKLPNQRAPAQLLVAVESTLQESSGSKTFSPTAYLMALVAMLDKASSQSGSDSSSSLLSSTLYLLTLVTPFVSPAVLHAQVHALIEPLSVVLSNTQHTVATDAAESQAALLRSALGIFEPLLLALASDRAMLSSDLRLRGCWNATLRLCLDARPKVRRRAQDLVGQVLQYSDTTQDSVGNAKAHPFAVKTAEWATAALAEVGASGSVKKQQAPKYDVKAGRAKQPEVAAAARQKNIDGGSANSGIWICGFLRMLAPTLPSKSIPSLTANLLRVIGQNNPFLSAAAFEVFESLFKISRPMAIQNGLSTQTLGSSSLSLNSANTRSVHADALVSTLDALLSANVKPKVTDIQLISPYLRALENAMVAYSRVQDGQPAWERVPIVWTTVKEMAFSSQSKASRDAISVRMAGRDCLSAIVRYCIPDLAIEQALTASKASGKEKDELLNIISFFDEAFSKNALRYSHSWPEIFGVLTAVVLRLRYKPKAGSVKSSKGKSHQSTPAAATTLVLPLLSVIGQLRSQPKFDHREQVDGVIGALVQVCGPQAVLEILPLGLLGENGAQNGRAWLLPLMRSNITNTTLAHFVQTMVPMSEALFNKQAEAEELDANGKPVAPVQAKVYEALTEQIWALLPGYCDLPVDMLDALTQQFVELLANVLYSQPSLRPSICRALQVLVERSQSLARSAAPSEMLLESFGVSNADGKKYVARLAEIAPNLLAVFFNIFSQSPGESRGYVADCMTAYMSIMTADEIGKTYQKIVNTLEQSLPTLQTGNKDNGPKAIPPIPHTMMDLLILMVPFLTQAEADALFSLGTSDALFAHRDAAVQKKSYRVLARLMEGSRGAKVLGVGENESGKLPELLEKLQATTGSVVVGAKRDRTALLASIMPLIPATELHVLPSIIPEAVLATKEVNQGARELAYRLLVEMGNKMDAGGMIKRGLMEGEENVGNDDEDADMDSKTVSANINEYITMVAAGLAGTSPHMISASITALARLVYEFHEKVPSQTLEEMVGTMDIFLASPNREVAKSALGFVKVVIVSLPAEIIDVNLPGLVGALFSSSKYHRVHFKAKIRHIFERLLRRFGYKRIEQLTDEDNRKLLVNIRKRKERSKRKKAGQDDAAMEQDDDEVDKPQMGQRAQKTVGADAFEEAIYGSESEISDSDDDEEDDHGERNGQRSSAPSKGQKRDKNISAIEQEYLLQDDDAPMDLLDRGALASGGKVTASGGKQPSASRKRQPGQEASRFTLDEETGRMVIEDPDEPQTDEEENQIDVEGAGRAYLDRERGVHGMSTDKNGKVRLNKNNKRNRAADEEMEAEQMELEEQLAALQRQREAASETNGTSATNNKKRKQERKQIGQEFRAKKAGGDIKRGETSPFAYVPLQKVGGKKPGKAGKSDIRFLGKDKKRRS
ncbi:NUC173-domain-containing protein [Meira miltonrushii]|uniref:NUC173-domain-containing protein n=1 Tax=Meira miltonrushii TaxID=1280837 RepID=A0A316VJS1_9BASI|nr:NUC173-domain-containing protein [Meira miltonrushii]PWN37806.1 NUC173-domain-containing protein [Meira miltonrushii]